MPDIPSFILERAQAQELIFIADEVAEWRAGLLDQLVADDILTPTSNATSVTCDACGDDHGELVQFVEYPPGSELRMYIPCPENGRVRVSLDRLHRWTVNLDVVFAENASVDGSRTSQFDATHFNGPSTIDEPICERGQLVLVAMFELTAFDSDSLKSTEEIATKAFGDGADSNSLKRVMSELRTREFVSSKTGRGGGYWLASKGQNRAKKLRTCLGTV